MTKILIVEDELIIAEDIKEYLKMNKHYVTGTAVSFQRAKESILNEKPDIILMDINIRGNKDGIESAKIFLEEYNIPSIFLTGYSDKNVVENAKRIIPYGYILKPVVYERLLITIEIALYKFKYDQTLKLFINNATDQFLFFDYNLYLRFANSVFADRFNIPKETVIGKHISDFSLEESEVDRIKDYEDVIKTGKPFSYTGRMTLPMIGTRYIEINAFKANDGLGVIIKDLTDKKKQEEEQLINQRMMLRNQRLTALGELSVSLAHEIRQPLQVIKVIVDSIIYWYKKNKETDFETFQKHMESLKEVSKNAARINNIIELLQKMTKKTGTIKAKEININSSINELLKFFKQKIKYHSIKLILELDNSIKPYKISNTQLELVITNILTNAINALDSIQKENKKITIKTVENNESIEILIKDNGPGINPENLERIFNPLFTTGFKTESMGLGLYIVHNIIESNNGIITAGNNEDGETEFKITLKRESKQNENLLGKK